MMSGIIFLPLAVLLYTQGMPEKALHCVPTPPNWPTDSKMLCYPLPDPPPNPDEDHA